MINFLKAARWELILILLILGVVFLPGCATGHNLQNIRVAIPVVCTAQEPERPIMQTERLKPDATDDAFTQAAIAEIESREGFEIKLLSALRECTAPLTP